MSVATRQRLHEGHNEHRRHVGVGAWPWLLGALVVHSLNSGCNRVTAPPCTQAALIAKTADSPVCYAAPDVYKHYIPARLLSSEGIWPSEAEWWVGKLLDFKESPLLETVANPGVEAYRILRIPSLVMTGDWVIRAEKTAVGASVLSKRSVPCNAGKEAGHDWDWGRDVVTGSARLDEATWSEVSSCMKRAFWDAPAREPEMGTDGTLFVVEGIRGGDYHLISRQHLSDQSDPIFACIGLLDV